MRKRVYLPKTLQELKSMDREKIKELWQRYFKDSPGLAALIGDSEGDEGTSGPSLESAKGSQGDVATGSLSLTRMLRPLWYEIQCENHNIHIEQKNVTRLNKYSADPEGCIEKAHVVKYHIRSGTEIVKTFQGKQFKVMVRSPREFIYDGQSYGTLSAVAKVICGKKVSGYDFFGLDNKLRQRSMETRPEAESMEEVADCSE